MCPKQVRRLFKLAELRRRIDLIGTWSSMACARVRAIINIWNGVVICVCVLCNKMASYMHSTQKYSLKKWRLGEATIFFKLWYRALRARKWSGFMCK